MSEQEAIIGNDWLRNLENKAEESNKLRKDNERLREFLCDIRDSESCPDLIRRIDETLNEKS